MVRFGILGAGRIGNVHAKTIAGSGRARVAYVADAIPEAAEKLKHFKGRYRKLKVIPVGSDDQAGVEKLKATLSELTAEQPA